MELFNYYSLDECKDRKEILKKLKSLKKEGKIDFSIDGEIFNITDLDLEEYEVEELLEKFDSMDVFPYLEREEDEDDFGYYDDDDDDY
jgi:hypothetical protein